MPIEIRNISLGGLSADAADFIAIGTEVEVVIAGQEAIPGRIAWQLGKSTGVEFESELRMSKIIALSLEHLRMPDDEGPLRGDQGPLGQG